MVERVVCVDDSLQDDRVWLGEPVVKGRIYEIRGRFICPGNGREHVRLVGIKSVLHPVMFTETGYRASRFAPVKETNISIFTAIDRDVFEGVDA